MLRKTKLNVAQHFTWTPNVAPRVSADNLTFNDLEESDGQGMVPETTGEMEGGEQGPRLAVLPKQASTAVRLI